MKEANKKEFNKKVREAKKTFPSHCKIRLRIKEYPVNPYNSTYMEKIIEMRHFHPEYEFYIHERDKYVRYSCSTIENFEPVKIQIDDKLWIELLSVFNFVRKVEQD